MQPRAVCRRTGFFLVRFSAVNSGSENPVPAMTIEDDQGQPYEELPNGEGVPQWAGYLRNVKPAESVQGNALFDAPPAHYKLKLSDESGSNSPWSTFPFPFGAETPAVPVPASGSSRRVAYAAICRAANVASDIRITMKACGRYSPPFCCCRRPTLPRKV